MIVLHGELNTVEPIRAAQLRHKLTFADHTELLR